MNKQDHRWQDARLKKALENMPEAQVHVNQEIRASILHAAKQAIEQQTQTSLNKEHCQAKQHNWLERACMYLFGSPRMAWPALGGFLVVGFVGLLWSINDPNQTLDQGDILGAPQTPASSHTEVIKEGKVYSEDLGPSIEIIAPAPNNPDVYNSEQQADDQIHDYGAKETIRKNSSALDVPTPIDKTIKKSEHKRLEELSSGQQTHNQNTIPATGDSSGIAHVKAESTRQFQEQDKKKSHRVINPSSAKAFPEDVGAAEDILIPTNSLAMEDQAEQLSHPFIEEPTLESFDLNSETQDSTEQLYGVVAEENISLDQNTTAYSGVSHQAGAGFVGSDHSQNIKTDILVVENVSEEVQHNTSVTATAATRDESVADAFTDRHSTYSPSHGNNYQTRQAADSQTTPPPVVTDVSREEDVAIDASQLISEISMDAPQEPLPLLEIKSINDHSDFNNQTQDLPMQFDALSGKNDALLSQSSENAPGVSHLAGIDTSSVSGSNHSDRIQTEQERDIPIDEVPSQEVPQKANLRMLDHNIPRQVKFRDRHSNYVPLDIENDHNGQTSNLQGTIVAGNQGQEQLSKQAQYDRKSSSLSGSTGDVTSNEKNRTAAESVSVSAGAARPEPKDVKALSENIYNNWDSVKVVLPSSKTSYTFLRGQVEKLSALLFASLNANSMHEISKAQFNPTAQMLILNLSRHGKRVASVYLDNQNVYLVLGNSAEATILKGQHSEKKMKAYIDYFK